MQARWTFRKLIQAFSCLVFALSLVLLPAFSGAHDHAGSAMHGASSLVAAATQDADAASPHCANHKQASAQPDDLSSASSVCCDSICVAVVIADVPRTPDIPHGEEHHGVRGAVFAGSAIHGLLRPPKLA